MLQVLIVAGMLICAFRAIRTQRLLFSAIWLAGSSALLALLMYLLGAVEVAVIELSVGAGLVTVLFVFAINIAGEENETKITSIPWALASFLVLIAAVAVGWLVMPDLRALPASPEAFTFREMVWQNRLLDVILQGALLFAGAMGVIGLLSEGQIQLPKERES